MLLKKGTCIILVAPYKYAFSGNNSMYCKIIKDTKDFFIVEEFFDHWDFKKNKIVFNKLSESTICKRNLLLWKKVDYSF